VVAFGAEDPVLRAMRDELQRSMTLNFASLDKPYYLEYAMEDGHRVQVNAVLDGIVSVDETDYRVPRVSIRVGSAHFDNTNYVGSRLSYSGRYGAAFPLEDDYGTLRRSFWLATDVAYKSALEAISRKRAALKNVSVSEELPDFSPAEPVKKLLDIQRTKIDADAWKSRVKTISSVFLKYPEIRTSAVDFNASDGTRRMVTSDGVEIRLPETESQLRLQVVSQAKDGMTLRDAAVFNCLGLDGLPSQPELLKVAEDLGASVTAMAAAPRGEDYSGPVLFDGMASAQLLAELLGHNLQISRKPVSDPGGGGGSMASELEGRKGSRILPESFSIVDDPSMKTWKGHRLFGSIEVDEEGVAAKPLSIVEKGVLKNFVLTRQPVRGYPTTNGRARLQGQYGHAVAGITNLIVQSNETLKTAELKARMIDMLKQRDKPFGIIVRKMDFPSTATGNEVRRLISGAARTGGARPISLPLRVYRVYVDGHEEMIRGVRFRSLNVRSLKDVVAAGDDSNVFSYRVTRSGG
jgi:predicted Zn-dependent protease